MATGRGLILQQHIDQQQRQSAGQILESVAPSSSTMKYSKAQPHTSQNPCLKKFQTQKAFSPKTCGKKYGRLNTGKHSSKKSSYIDSLPSEILLKIFSYLDVISLICIGSVNRNFFQLSKDNLLWYRMYCSSVFVKNSRWKSNMVVLVADKLSTFDLQEKPPGFWKTTYINSILGIRKRRINQILKSIKYNMGIPSNIEMIVKMSGLRWAITFKDASGGENVIEQVETLFTHSSLTLSWESLLWPSLGSVTKLKLQGIAPVFLDACVIPTKSGRPQRFSLIAEYDITDLKSSKIIGYDHHINVHHLHPGLLIGVWKKDYEIAFVMATLHYHQILEKSILGFPDQVYTFPPHTPILDDIDPNYGLHGYQLHVDMHNGLRTYFCGTFRNLFCKKDYIRKGFLRLTAIGINDSMKHAPLIGKVGLVWKNITFQGYIQKCFMMDVTVFDETEKPFWCLSSPVKLLASKSSETHCNFMGQTFNLNYMDQEGKVKAELVWMNETEEYYIINLVLYLSTEKVNSWFATNY
ncbi:F-box only 15 isoform X1 [Pelobates cultripes]|uniref:F-box only 15 isoform X1 n=1 Tax=Pelobates cultripes TaxID=61616 RepID=A0AAD1W5Y4_PELCU|nr:F-box only 15 isoform X1 [Pelobates cultripes]